MRTTRATAVVFALGLLVASSPVRAHHANAIFDAGKKVTLKGTVTEWFWANPHCLLRFEVRNDSGEVVRWVAETQAPPNMIPWGWSKQSFRAGDEVTLVIEPVKNGQPLGRILQALLADGTTIFASGSAPIPPGAAGAAPTPR